MNDKCVGRDTTKQLSKRKSVRMKFEFGDNERHKLMNENQFHIESMFSGPATADLFTEQKMQLLFCN